MRPRDIGTRAESACRDYLRAHGWPDCDRQPLRGKLDHGDLIICREPRIIAECKAGKTAEKASDNLIREWMRQTEDEAVNAGADLGVLIVRRFGRPPALWDVYLPAADWVWLVAGVATVPTDTTPLRAALADWSEMALKRVSS